MLALDKPLEDESGRKPQRNLANVRFGARGRSSPRSFGDRLFPCLVFVFFFPPITECYTVPGAPPRNVTGQAISPTSILVTWEPPPADRSNGRIVYYKLQVVESGRSDSEAKVIRLNDTRFVLDELKKWTEYRIWVLAGTSVGDGPPSYPISVRTHEDGMYH